MSDPNEADFSGYDRLFDPARQAAQEPSEPDPAYEAWLIARVCPTHGATRVAEEGEVPSMLGSGWESWERQECGCTLTWEPFTGEERWTPAR